MCTHLDVIDSGLEAGILKIPKDISEMWVWATTPRKLPSNYLLTDFVRGLVVRAHA